MRTVQEEYERIQKYAAPWNKIGNYVMNSEEMAAFLICSPDVWHAVSLAFRFGFEKGCRKTKKMMNT